MEPINTFAEIQAKNKDKIHFKAFLCAVLLGIAALVTLGYLMYNNPTFLTKLVFILLSPIAVIGITAAYIYFDMSSAGAHNGWLLHKYRSKFFTDSREKLCFGWQNHAGLKLNTLELYYTGNHYLISIDFLTETDSSENTYEYVKLAPVVDCNPNDNYKILIYKNYCRKILVNDWEHLSIDNFHAYITDIEEMLLQGNIEAVTLDTIEAKRTVKLI